MTPECQGKNISECEGEIKRYRVLSKDGPIKDWGTFHYCEAHAQRDRNMGFELKEEKP